MSKSTFFDKIEKKDLQVRLLGGTYPRIKQQLVEALYKQPEEVIKDLHNVIDDILENYLIVPKSNVESFVKINNKGLRLIGTMSMKVEHYISPDIKQELLPEEYEGLMETLHNGIIHMFMESLEKPQDKDNGTKHNETNKGVRK